MERVLKFALVLLIPFVYFGCGVYGFRGNNPPPGISSIAVPTFQDNSGFSSPTLPEDLTQQLKQKILNDNTFRIADKTVADAILKCTIVNVKDEALVISSGENVAQRRITITVSVIFENLKKQRVIWEKNFENFGEYNSSDNTFSNRAVGINEAVDRIAEDILIDLTSNW